MARMTVSYSAVRQADLDHLRGLVPPGTRVYTVIRHVTRSGMGRSISLFVVQDGKIVDITYLVARVMALPLDLDNGGIKVQGCGMDMAFHLVYSLSSHLYWEGFGCIGRGCPSNDHSNGDRDYTVHGGEDADLTPGEIADGMTKHWHEEGGYALRKESL